MRRPCSLFAALLLAAPAAAAPPEPAVLARRIDQRLGERHKQAGVTPAPLTDDAAYLRRVYLDLAGRIPTTHEVHTFLLDKDPAKRAKVVEKLLNGPTYVKHFTNVYRALLLPETMANFEVRYLQPGFDEWLRQKLRANAPYDRMAYELVAAPIPTDRRNPNYGQPGMGPLAFFQAKEAKAENIAASVSRVFLGVQIECAQCHNHPFARWSRDQFWGTAAFFGGIERPQANIYSPIREVVDRRELTIPNTEKTVQAEFLDGTEPEWKFKTSARVTFAEWLTAPQNPWFARAGANRVWAHLMGTGIIDPPDDLHDDNKPSHPELLDELAKAFVESKFDLHYLIQAVTASEAYQRSSAVTDPRQQDPRLFARMAVKGLTGEQLLESLAVATGGPARVASNPFDGNPQQSSFFEKFALPGKKTDPQTTILQALTLMNGQTLAEATDPARGTTLGAVADMPLMSTAEKVEALYLTTLSRKPTPEELRLMVRHVEHGGTPPKQAVGEAAVGLLKRVYGEPDPNSPANQMKKRLGDVLWVLLNSAEFRFNH